MALRKGEAMKRKAKGKPQPTPAKTPVPEIEFLKPTGPVNVKLTLTEHVVLNRIVAAGHYESKSAAIRAGLGVIFEKHKITKEEEMRIEKERRFHYPRRSRRR
jgi:Arc/MetJ-type ribon-helix-helix transcriptional regulator